MVQYLSVKLRQEILYLYNGNSARRTAQLFNENYPNRAPINHSTVLKIVNKFKTTGSLHDRPRSGRPSLRNDEETLFSVLAQAVENPRLSSRNIAKTSGISQKLVLNILHDNAFRSYKAKKVHFMEADDRPRRLRFAQDMRLALNDDENVLSNVLFSDESLFVLRHAFNRQNTR